MIINPENTRPRRSSLIEDIAPPHTEQYTDVNREEVRRRSIGSLYQQYLRNSKAKINTLRKRKALERQKKRVQPAVQVIEPVKPLTRLRYSVVPPLQSLPSFGPSNAQGRISMPGNSGSFFGGILGWLSDTRPHVGLMASRIQKKTTELFSSATHTLSIPWLSIKGWFNRAALKMLPKRYIASSGLVVDWQAKSLSRMKLAIPAFLGVLVLTVALWAGPAGLPPSNNSKSDTPNQNNGLPPTVNQGDKDESSNSSSSTPSNSSTPRPIPPSSASTVSPVAPTPTGAASSTPLTGGGAGGSGGGTINPLPIPTPLPPSLPLPTPAPPSPLPSPALPPTQQLLDTVQTVIPTNSGL